MPVNALSFKKPEIMFSQLCHSHELLALWDILQTEMTDFPTLSYTSTSDFTTLSHTWSVKKVPYQAEPLRKGHYREYPPSPPAQDQFWWIILDVGDVKGEFVHQYQGLIVLNT